MKRKAKGRARRRAPRRTPVVEPPEAIEPPVDTSVGQPGTDARLSGGDVDADWSRADSTGDEAVGGSVATPDQDVVDELARALGVEQASDAEVVSSEEILRQRDQFRWHLERDAEGRAREADERGERESREAEPGQ